MGFKETTTHSLQYHLLNPWFSSHKHHILHINGLVQGKNHTGGKKKNKTKTGDISWKKTMVSGCFWYYSHKYWYWVCSFTMSPPTLAGWWFGTFFIFPYIGNNHPNWLIFFRGVQTTNQYPFTIASPTGLATLALFVFQPSSLRVFAPSAMLVAMGDAATWCDFFWAEHWGKLDKEWLGDLMEFNVCEWLWNVILWGLMGFHGVWMDLMYVTVLFERS